MGHSLGQECLEHSYHFKKGHSFTEKKVSSLRRKEKLVKGEPGETERSYVIQELIDHVMDFTF